jgi:diaminohydroxyphosphoribosylaminopyrimidine deaminase/5-amino-6-(5-phosphoribosylamino)uracil reductase
MHTRAPEEFMKMALNMARSFSRAVLPNPAVGAVLVANGAIIGAGCHQRFGGPHAEVNAIASVKHSELLADSTLYVTLEPCAHTGKTPPCVDLILASHIPRVVVGCRDPHRQVSGRGIERLRNAGVSVTEGLLHDECVLANRRFLLAHRELRPYIILKWAQTQNGFMAPASGEPTQISSMRSQQLLHYWRGQEMAIAVGSETVRTDNPRLTARHLELYRENELPPNQPTRIVLGNAGRLPEDRAIWKPDATTIIFSSAEEPSKTYPSRTVILQCPTNEPFIPQLCRALYDQQLLSLIVEGGPRTIQSFIDADLWDEIRVFTAPCTFSSGLAAPIPPHTAQVTLTSGLDTLELIAHPKLASRLSIAESSINPLLASAVPPRHYHQPEHSQSE